MRCPHCQASNPDNAAFCGQCYERFPTATDTAARPEDGTATPPDGLPQGAADQPATEPGLEGPRPHGGERGTTSAGPVVVGRFVASEEGLTWRCAICETTHPVGVFVCTVCGAKMDEEARGAGAAPPVQLEQARRLEAMMPGVGHLRTGHTGMGAARAGIVVFWLLFALVLATGGPSGLLAALPLILGLVGIWATGPGDLAAATAGREPRLDARRFMYVVIGVTTAVIIAGGLAVAL